MPFDLTLVPLILIALYLMSADVKAAFGLDRPKA